MEKIIYDKIKVQKDKNTKLDNNRGITLIALVITILVLLILVGVTIAALTGQNGIVSNAQKAKTSTNEAGIIENISSAYNYAQTEKYAKGADSISVDDIKSDLGNTYGTGNVTVNKEDDGTFTVTISEKGTYIIALDGTVTKNS
jgi:Tfp pilus assembly protein PilE